MNMSKKISILGGVRVVMVVLLLAFIIFLQLGDKNSSASVDEVSKKILSSIDTQSMEEAAPRIFKKFYGLNANDYEGVCLYAPSTNMNAEELLIVKVKDNSQVETLTNAIQKRLETQKTSFEGYGIEQYDLLKHHILDVHGNFILYVVHKDASKADQTFRKSL